MLHENEDYWIPLADVMTGMMLVFMLALAMFVIKINSTQIKVVKAIQSVKQVEDTQQQFNLARYNLGMAIESNFAQSALKWSATIDPKNLTIGFNNGEILFATGKSQLNGKFKLILDDFFPRLLSIVQSPAYESYVQGISIEGFSSSKWADKNLDEAYLKNMKLSEERSLSVFNYLFRDSKLISNRDYLMNNVSVTGNSSAHLVRLNDGREDISSSQRVEFRIILKTTKK